MKWLFDASRPHLRRLGTAVAITGAAAAVAGGVVLAERPESDRLSRPAAIAVPVTDSSAQGPAPHHQTRSPKDADRLMPGPWVKRSRVHASADPVDAEPSASADLSLPAAAEALAHRPADTAEAPPSF